MQFKNSTKHFFRNSQFLALALAVLIFSCKGKDDEVKPQETVNKAFENGFVKGTVKGTRTDGTAFEEPFEYKIASPESFEKVSTTMDRLELDRSQNLNEGDMNSTSIGLAVTNKAQNPTAKFENFDIWFTKLLSNRDLFHIQGTANFEATDVTLPISRDNNVTYKLLNYGNNYDYYYDPATGDDYRTYADESGNKIYFIDTYNATYGSHYKFSYVINSSGVKSTTSATFGNLLVDYNNISGKYLFYTAADVNLSEKITIPADTQEITNFVYNASTGVVTFNYKVSINELRGMQNYNAKNTTNHKLDITGSASATVYNGTVMRMSAE